MVLCCFALGYVGLGTVSAATWWYLFDEEGPQVTFYQLVSNKSTFFLVLMPVITAGIRYCRFIFP